MTQQQEALTCATHPEVSTNLRCGKCEKLICSRCLVHTPVGPRCAGCAQPRRLPTFVVTPGHYARAAGASLGLALVAGLVWGAVPFGGLLSFFLSPLAGYCIGEGVSRAANRRRSLGLKVLAGAGVFLAYTVARAGAAFLPATLLLLSGAPGPLLALAASALLGTLLSPLAWLIIAVGVYLAVSRVG